jgi:hypothetical protein
LYYLRVQLGDVLVQGNPVLFKEVKLQREGVQECLQIYIFNKSTGQDGEGLNVRSAYEHVDDPVQQESASEGLQDVGTPVQESGYDCFGDVGSAARPLSRHPGLNP